MNVFISILISFLFFYFIISSVLKLTNPSSFVEFVAEYRMLPISLSKIYGWLLPYVELAAALFLLFSSSMVYGVLLLMCVLASFLFAVIKVIQTNQTVSCGCYGKWLDAKADSFTLFKILLLLFLTVVSLLTINHIQVSFDLLPVSFGFILTILLFISQKGWSLHQETMSMLKKP